jgi:hypothetical protein
MLPQWIDYSFHNLIWQPGCAAACMAVFIATHALRLVVLQFAFVTAYCARRRITQQYRGACFELKMRVASPIVTARDGEEAA